MSRRDRNEDELVAVAEALGATMENEGPLDWLCWFKGNWTPVEIKDPSVEGHKNEFTDKQKRFRIRCKERGARMWVWRVEADVYFSLGARRTA